MKGASRSFFALIASAACALPAHAAPSYCLTLYGDCKYKPGFAHFDYVNPQAPKGGDVKLAEIGTFDSLSPFLMKGVKAPGIQTLYETLMTPSLDEPETLYGLVAESVDLSPDRKTATFVLRKEARWHDGTPVTPEDVIFSFHALKDKGDPTWRIQLSPIAEVKKTGPRAVTFTFSDTQNREPPLIAAQMPILPAHYYAVHDFSEATLTPPLTSGAYEVEKVDPGHFIIYRRVKNYWGAKLPVNVGQNNFEHIRYDMYRDENVALEAFKAGAFDFHQEYIARNWAGAYNCPALRDGRIIKRAIPDATPQGMQGFVFNTRLPKLSDRRVREAIGLTLDFAWLNKTIFYGAYARDVSYFENTPFEADGLPSKAEVKLLKPFAALLPPGIFTEPFRVPVTDGSGDARKNLIKAQKLLEEAGWVLKNRKRVNAKTGEPLTLEFLIMQPTMERVVGQMRHNLAKLGIDASLRRVDEAQYQSRLEDHDFEIISTWINRGVFFPGNEQVAMWQSGQADVKGGNNLAGVKNPAVDAALAGLAAAKTLPELEVAGRALDRVLLWEHYMIPHWHSDSFRVAYWNKFGIPAASPKYNIGFGTWWLKK